MCSFPGATGNEAYASREGSGTKLELERANDVFELPVKFVPYRQSTSESSNTGACFSLSLLEQIGSLMHKSSTEQPK